MSAPLEPAPPAPYPTMAPGPPPLILASTSRHRRAQLERLGLEPLLTMQFRLGEGSGAMAAVPLVKAGCRVVSDVATFDEFFGSDDDAAAS